jgi:basic membrane lipoprotein Med (substrate-binding protein (PBP1-ABC) superfamily)/DNA-binding SARP family transcriptional activator
MEFQVLGPLVVRRDGEPIDLGPRQQQAVLALLIINANQLVPVARIQQEIWGDDAEGKENALRVYVSRLRSALEPDRARGESSMLETRGAAYQLNLDTDRLDAVFFESEVARGRDLLETNPGAAAEALRSALDMWTGDAYVEFAYEDFSQVERHRLGETRVAAIEDRVAADLAMGLSGELVSELEVLRDLHPLRETLSCHEALALYRSGRPAEALRAIGRFRRHVGEELGIDPSPRLLRLEEQILLHDDSIQPRVDAETGWDGRLVEAANPYKGLRAFGLDDAASFFGRDALVAELLRALGAGQHLVTLVGASGSGKSSVVRAGLVPALAKGAIDGSDGWLVAHMMPGDHPFAELEAALLRTTINGPDSLTEQLEDQTAGLLRAALRVLPEDSSRLVLVIDQFEELFTLVEDGDVRDRFLSNLVTAVNDPRGRISVLLTLRADFYGHSLHHPEFGARVGNGVVNVTQLRAEELEAAAIGPAGLAGVTLEPALLGQLITDVGHQPGALPLFQYSLTELFDRRSGDTLTAASYRSMGGLDGALHRRATNIYEEFDAAQQEATRQLFLRLVAISEHGHHSRRRVGAREVVSLTPDVATMQHVIAQLGAHRLLSFDSDKLTGAPTVEVAHEALLTSWTTLSEWIDAGREDLRRHGSLSTAMREWQLADEDPSYLLPAARLAEYRSWSAASAMALNDAERRYLDAGDELVEQLQATEQRRVRDEATSRRRLWGLVGALAAALGIAAIFLFGVFGSGEPTVLTFYGNRLSGSWNANVASGVDRAALEFGAEVVDVPWVVEPGAEFRTLAETGPEILIVSDRLGPDRDPEVVGDFPAVQFGLVGLEVPGLNVTSVLFANEEGAFLAGAAAAGRTQTGVVGFIGAERNPEIEEFRAGFEAGAFAVDPDVIVFAVFVDQVGDMEFTGFARPDVGEARATALYQRGADVLFAAAGFSGFGMFEAAAEQSTATGTHLWAIGVDNDQWFEVDLEHRPHVLTSVIKRGDVASYLLVEHMLDGGDAGTIERLGLAEEGFDYSTEGSGLTAEAIVLLDRFVADVSSGRVQVPTKPLGEILWLDLEGNEIDAPEADDND